jgi:hypothetical protein
MPVALTTADVDRSRVADLVSVDALADAFSVFVNATDPGPACLGDCDDSRRVDIDELVRSVGIALGRGSVAECLAADPDASATVTINELIAAVNNALSGC